jgi:very-short-patch-repair endonuclease
MVNCKTCGKETNKKVYCSKDCQHKGYRIFKVYSKPKIEKVCEYCKKSFEILESSKRKYCSRICKDTHQKEKYSGKGNPMYQKEVSKDTRQKHSTISKTLWKNEEFRKKVKEGINNYIEENGYYPGTDKNSLEKRKKTNLERYGYEHNWNGKYGERECDITYIKKYNKTSIDNMNDILRNMSKSNPEKTFENYLKELGIEYVFQYELGGRHFDFRLENKNIVIEIDGDYHHGKGKLYEEMDELQKKSYKNDKIKNKIIKNKGWKLIRIWESDLYKMNINDIKKLLWEK